MLYDYFNECDGVYAILITPIRVSLQRAVNNSP